MYQEKSKNGSTKVLAATTCLTGVCVESYTRLTLFIMFDIVLVL